MDYNSFVFMGCKHCGKSTHGKLLAQKTGTVFFDVDSVIEDMCGSSVRQLFTEKGECAFKNAELAACKKIINECSSKKGDNNFSLSPVVISTGGGICDNSEAIKFLESVRENIGRGSEIKNRLCFVFLRLNIAYSVSRIMEKVSEISPGVFSGLPAYVSKKNPNTKEEVINILTETFKARELKYEKIADIIVDIKNAPIEENFNSIIRAISN